MYIGHGRLCVCLTVAAFPHYCTDPYVTLGNGRECPIVVHYWADLQSVHGFHCYNNIAPNAKCHECLYSLYVWLLVNIEFLNAKFGVLPSWRLKCRTHMCLMNVTFKYKFANFSIY